MPGFAVSKHDGNYYVSVVDLEATYEYPNRVPHENNYPLRVVKNKYGNIIVGGAQKARVLQILFANLHKFFKSNEHIDYQYLKFYFIPKFIEELDKNSNINNKDKDTGEYGIVADLFVISEGRAFYIREDGFIKEEDIFGNNRQVDSYLYAIKDDYENRDFKFVNRALKLFHLDYQIFMPGVITISTIDYTPKYTSLFKEDF